MAQQLLVIGQHLASIAVNLALIARNYVGIVYWRHIR